MDVNLNVTLQSADGQPFPLSPKKTDTVRSVIEAANIVTPPNTQLICMYKGNQLKMDLSLGFQGIQTNDTIFLVYKKVVRRKKKKAARKDDFEVVNALDPDAQQFVRRQNSIFEEALRVSDLSFLLFDYYRRTSNVYDLILQQQEEKNTNNSQANVSKTILSHQSNDVSCEPLPVCFKKQISIEAEEGDNVLSSMGNLANCHDMMKHQDGSDLQS